MFQSLVPTTAVHPFAAPPADDDVRAPPAIKPPLPPHLHKPFGLPAFTFGPGALLQDASVQALRRADVEMLFDNLRLHLEDKLEQQAALLEKISGEQQLQRELQESCAQELQRLSARANTKTTTRPASRASVNTSIYAGSTDMEDFGANGAELSPVPSQGVVSGEGQGTQDTSRFTVITKPKGRSPGRFHDEDQDECWVDGEGRLQWIYRTFSTFIESSIFDYIMGFFIITNTIFLGIQIDTKVKAVNAGSVDGNQEDFISEPKSFSAMESLFAAVFLLELLSRVLVQRTRFFCSGWNIFDTFVVASALLEECLKYGIGGDTIAGKVSVFRIMRVAKLLRTLRIIRVVRAFRELRIVLMAILKSMRSLFWTLCLLLVMLYFMSMLILVELTSDTGAYTGADEFADVRRRYFASLLRSIFTVYQTTTGGILWEEVSTALEKVVPWIAILWILYIGFVVYAIMNTVTGIFVDQAMKSAHDDMRNVALEEFDTRDGVIASLKSTLTRAVSHGKNELDRGLMLRVCRDKAVQRQLQACDVDPRDVFAFFDLIAGERKKISVRDIDSFLSNCFRLKGFARSIDVAALSFAQRSARFR